MRKLALTLSAIIFLILGGVVCLVVRRPAAVANTAGRGDYGPPPARRSLDHVRVAAENGFVVAREKIPPAADAAIPRATARFHLGGVDCGSCAPLVAMELGQLAGVREARVSQTVPEATVEFDPTRLTTRQVLGAIARTGLHPREESP